MTDNHYMKNILPLSLWVFLLALMHSCKPQGDFNYMQNIDSLALEASIKNAVSTIQPGDQLSIDLSANDRDAVSIFNQSVTNNNSSVQITTGGNVNATPNNVSQLPTFIVNNDGDINYPVLGKIHAAGLSLDEFTKVMEDKISRYVVNPVVNIKNTNYKVTVLGQVNKPGTYTIPDGQATLLSALGMAGDLTIYGERQNIRVLRNVDGKISNETIDISKADFINSPYYYLKQNDVIVVDANKTVQRSSILDPNTSIYISVASIIVTILALVFK